MPRKIQWILDTQTKTVHDAAAQMVDAKSFLFLGRHVGYPVAMEGALKLKEIAYTFTEGFAAGELKHGPIALVDEGEPVVFIVPPARGRNVLHAKVISGIEEVKARGAYIIAVAEENDPDVERYADVVFWRPACPTPAARRPVTRTATCGSPGTVSGVEGRRAHHTRRTITGSATTPAIVPTTTTARMPHAAGTGSASMTNSHTTAEITTRGNLMSTPARRRWPLRSG